MYQQLTTSQLWELSGGKDVRAFNELYKRVAKPLLQAAFKRTNDRDLSKDIVQELFIWLWERAEKLNKGSETPVDVEAYLHAALRNKIYNYYHAKMRAQEVVKSAFAHGGGTDQPPVQGALEYREFESALFGQIETLPAEMKKVFLLSRHHSLSIKEIARELRISEQTVKNQLGLASRRLRSLLHKLNYFLFFCSWFLPALPEC